MPNARPFVPALAALLLGLSSSRAAAQCDPVWLSGDPLRDVVGRIDGMISWDPDGSGPSGLSITICGAFSVGGIADGRVAWFDGAQWNAVGTPPGGEANSIAVYSGQLVIGSNSGVAVWTGSGWQTVGVLSPSGSVTAMTTYQGALVAAGSFSSVGGVAANGIAQWNGSSWAPLGTGIAGGPVDALAVFNGSLHVGGAFSTAGGASHVAYAIWNGSAWAPSPNFNGRVRALAARVGTSLSNSFLFAGGDFNLVGTQPNAVSVSRIASFSPTTNTWSDFGAGTGTNNCTALLVRATGISSYEVVAARALGGLYGVLQRFAAGTWTMLGTSQFELSPVRAITFLGGLYTVAQQGGIGASGVRQLVGSNWQPVVGPGVDRIATAVCDGGNDVVVADQHGVYRGGPGAWTELPGLVAEVHSLARLSNGDIVAGGLITSANGIPASGVARWNGTSWSALGGGVSGEVESLLALPNGELIVGGQFASAGTVTAANIARWTGSAWQPLSGGANGQVRALAVLPGGDVVAGGAFTFTGTFTNSTPSIARWNGSAWSAMTTGTGFDGPVNTLAIDGAGDLIAGGQFLTHNGANVHYLARWLGGGSWAAVPNTLGFIKRIVPFGSGDLAVLAADYGSQFGVFARVGSQVTLLTPSQSVSDMRVAANGDLLVGGMFTVLGGAVSQGYGRLSTPCPATVAAAGAGCAGSTLTADTLPWSGSVLRATATGLPVPAFALGVTGFAPVLPPLSLASVLPVALPGCALHTTLDRIDVSIAATGTSTQSLALPLNPSFAGIVLRQQVIALQFDASGAFTSVTSTNALALTVGVF